MKDFIDEIESARGPLFKARVELNLVRRELNQAKSDLRRARKAIRRTLQDEENFAVVTSPTLELLHVALKPAKRRKK